MHFSSRWGNLVIKLACILFTNGGFPLAVLLNSSKCWVPSLLKVSQLSWTIYPLLVPWHFWIIIPMLFIALHLQLISPSTFMAESEYALLTLLGCLCQLEDTHGSLDRAVLGRRPLSWATLVSCMRGCSSGQRHSSISNLAQNMAVFLIFQ